MRLSTLALLYILFGCGKQLKTTESASSVQAQIDTSSLPAETEQYPSIETHDSSPYRNELEKLPRAIPSSKQGLDLFASKYASENLQDNDRCLRDYLEFQTRLIDILNQQLERDPRASSIDSMVWADSAMWSDYGKKYEVELEANGLLLLAEEGIPYIDRNAETIHHYFYDQLTESTKQFLTQFEKETKEGFAADGGLIISLTALSDRIGFWDAFLKNYPDHLFSDIAKGKRDSFLYYFLAGMDNTWAFEDDGTINDQFLAAYRDHLKKYPSLESSRLIKAYLDILEKSGLKKSAESESFVDAMSK